MTARKSDDDKKPVDDKSDAVKQDPAKVVQTLDLTAEDITDIKDDAADAVKDASEDEAASKDDGAEDAVSDQALEEEVSSDKDADENAEISVQDTSDASDDMKKAETVEAPASVVEPAAAVAPAQTIVKKSSPVGGFIAGLVGGVAVLGAGYVGLQQGLVSLPASPAAQVEQDNKLAGLEGKLAELQGQIEAAPKVDVAALEKRIGDAEAGVSSLKETLNSLAAAPSAPTDGEAVEGEVKPPVVLLPDLSQFKEQIAKLEEGLSSVTGQVEGLKTLDSQLSTAKLQLSALEKQASEQAAAVEKRLGETKDEVLANAERRINVLVTDVADMGSKFVAASKELSDRMGALEENNVSEQMQSSARTIALAGLESAAASGRSFSAALQTFSHVVKGNEAVAGLEAFAAKGAPTLDKIAADFPALSGKMLKAADKEGAKSLVDKIMLNATSLVRVRPIGEVEGESLIAKLARIEVRAQDGRLSEIEKDWAGLPDAAKAEGKDWYDGVKARIAVDDLMAKISAEFGSDQAKAAE